MRLVFKTLPKPQDWNTHDFSSIFSSVQFFPPFLGTGSSHVRTRDLVPGPHCVLHDVQDDHRPQWPSTGAVRKHKMVKWLNVRCICTTIWPRTTFRSRSCLGLKTGLHYQSFCDHSRNFAWVILSFERFVRNVWRIGTDSLLIQKLCQCKPG
jgi:hypothetical protein